MDQNNCTPKKHNVIVGKCDHRGPSIRAVPAHCASFDASPSSVSGIGAKPVIGDKVLVFPLSVDSKSRI
jgi:hypothetical protein